MPSEQESIWLAMLNANDRKELSDAGSVAVEMAPDLLVLGGGIVGLATAYFAAERGLRVQVLAETRLAQDAEFSLGCIIPNACGWQFSAACQPLAQASRDWWAKLAVRPEFQLDWRVNGALMVDASRLTPNPRQQMLAALEAGFSVHEVDAEQIALLEPALAPCQLGGLHYPSEAVLNPLQAACGLVRGLRRRGGQITIAGVTGSQVSAGRLTGIQTAAGQIQPKAVFTDDLGLLQRILGEAVGPVMETTRRVFLASEPLSPLLKRPILDADWVVQLKSGEVLIESHAADDQTVPDWILTRLPALRDVAFSRRWIGTSQRLSDATPVVDKAAGLENVWYSGGLDFAAVMFAPIIGRSVSDWMLQGKPAEELAVFAVERPA